MMALGYTRYITSAQPVRGFRLIQCSLPPNAAHDAVGELAYRHKSFLRGGSSPAFAQRGGSHRKRASAPLILFHVCPRWLSSFFVTESEVATERFSEQRKSFRDSENQSGSQKADVNG